MRTKILFTIAALIFIGAISLVIYGEASVPDRKFHGVLMDFLPSARGEWRRIERQIAETPEMQAAVGEILNYDDGVFFDYVLGTRRLSVYIAYWTPGKMNYREIASHTPDVCWVMNGWVKESSKTIDLSGQFGRSMQKGESRRFTAGGRPEYVWFWHLIGGEVKSYGTGTIPPWYSAISDIFERGLNQREEQFFIRISSSEPLESFLDEPFFSELVNALPLGKSGDPS